MIFLCTSEAQSCKTTSPKSWRMTSRFETYFCGLTELVCVQAAIKPQYVDQIPRAVKGTVQAMLDRKDEMKNQDAICQAFGESGNWGVC